MRLDTPEDVDKQIAKIVTEVRKTKAGKFNDQLGRCEKELAELAARVQGAERRKAAAIKRKDDWLAAIKKIDDNKEPEVRAALQTTKAACRGKLAEANEDLDGLAREIEGLRNSKVTVDLKIDKIRDRIEFLCGGTARFSDTTDPETYLPDCRAEVAGAYRHATSLLELLHEPMDNAVLIHHFNEAASPLRELLLITDELDEKYVLQHTLERLRVLARKRGVNPDALREEFSPPGDDWALFGINEGTMAQARIQMLEAREKARVEKPDSKLESDPFRDRLLKSGLARYLRGKTVLFYGANMYREWTPQMIQFFEKELGAKVIWCGISDDERAVSQLVNNKADLLVIWTQFKVPGVRKRNVFDAGQDIPRFLATRNNLEAFFTEFGEFLKMPLNGKSN